MSFTTGLSTCISSAPTGGGVKPGAAPPHAAAASAKAMSVRMTKLLASDLRLDTIFDLPIGKQNLPAGKLHGTS